MPKSTPDTDTDNKTTPPATKSLASQTLFRGLEVVNAVAEGFRSVREISERTGITFSTTHRLASALVQIHYLHFEPRKGYRLGRRLLELGFLAYRESAVTTSARPILEELAATTLDTVHLAALDNDGIVYLDKVSGHRPIEVSTRIGGRKPICTTSVGKALILDEGPTGWKARYAADKANGSIGAVSQAAWLTSMTGYAKVGHTQDLEEDHAGIRCVGAPVRDASGAIVAAVSVSSTDGYTDLARMRALAPLVLQAARRISVQLGAAP